MRWNLRLFQLGFFCVLVLLSTGSVAVASGDSGRVTMFVEVAPGFAISVQDSLTFPQAAPGRSVEAELDVTVWSNVDWELMAASIAVHSEDGTSHVLDGAVEILDATGLDAYGVRAFGSDGRTPTSQEGQAFSVPYASNLASVMGLVHILSKCSSRWCPLCEMGWSLQ